MLSNHWQTDLDAFRAAYSLQRRVIDGHEWDYFVCGEGEQALLVLPGGLAVAETAFRSIHRFVGRYRIIAPTYPATIMTMAQLVGGLAQLVRGAGIGRIHVVGGSYSGLVAQCLVRSAPELVANLVLSDTGVPRPVRACWYGLMQPVLRYAPLWMLRGGLWAGVRLFLWRMPTNRAFWWRYFRARTAHISRAECLSHLAIWRDFDRRYRFSAADLAAWHGRILLIEAEHDGLFRPAEQMALRRLYPSAQIHTFANSPHGASLARMDDYLAVIERFLAENVEHRA